jgi:hypothetical protein
MVQLFIMVGKRNLSELPSQQYEFRGAWCPWQHGSYSMSQEEMPVEEVP